MIRKLPILLLVLGIAVVWGFAETWLPPFQELPDTSNLMHREEVPFLGAEAEGVLTAGAYCETYSLDGMWKLSPLDIFERPFPPVNDEERALAAPDYDDSGWNDIKVPLNWFLHPANSYGKLAPALRKLDGTQGAGIADCAYIKGWYRHTFNVPALAAGTRAFLHFERIGYEADVFVNGIQAPKRHHGEFIEFITEITDLLVPGENTLAVRVMTNYRPYDGRYTHTHGAQWGFNAGGFKGGLWGHVSLEIKRNPIVTSAKIVAKRNGHFEIRAIVDYQGKTPLEVTPSLSICKAEKGPSPMAKAFEPATFNPGENELVFSVEVENPDVWSPWSPALYFAVLSFQKDGQTLSAHVGRFGFRDIEIRGSDFYVNGTKMFLFFESAHSERFGGYDTPTRNRGRYDILDDGQSRMALPEGATPPSFDTVTTISNYRKRGYTMLRTAHSPIIPEFLDAADELGMMIYSEWGLAFTHRIDEPAFSANNRQELEQYVRETHNHPSLVLWSMGNEVFHKDDEALARQMDNQVEWMHELDLQRRPVCSFAGMLDVESYGQGPMKTDFFDFHTYDGFSVPWTRANTSVRIRTQIAERSYGKIKTPLLISECVGGGWGNSYDDAYSQNPEHYLEVMAKPHPWANPGPAGYSGAIGVEAASDRHRGMLFLQNRIGRRVLDLFRQNPKVAGFAPWFADCEMESAVVWNQPYYPGLRLTKERPLAPRQWLANEERPVELFVHNAGPEPLDAPVIRLSLVTDGQETALADVPLPDVAPGERAFVETKLSLPSSRECGGELRLTLFDQGIEKGRNSYLVTIHERPAPIPEEHMRRIAVIMPTDEIIKALAEAGMTATPVDSLEALADFDRAILQGGGDLPAEFHTGIRNWVQAGGFLAIMEPNGLQHAPCFPEFGLFDTTAPLVERVVPSHPVFNSLSMDDLDAWAEALEGGVASKVLTPFHPGILAGIGHFMHERPAGMAATEVLFGNGRLLISSIRALECRNTNGAAAVFLNNLLRYVADDRIELADSQAILIDRHTRSRFDPGTNEFQFIDLRPYANRDFRDDAASDGQGGWTDQGANDFRNIPTGRQEVAGVPFDIINPVQNGGKGCILLNGEQLRQTTNQVEAIPVHATAKALYFLHTCAYLNGKDPFAFYTIHYSDGRQAVVPVVPNVNISDWWGQSAPSNAFMGLSASNAYANKVYFFAFEWLNPFPDVIIDSIDFSSTGRGPVPVLAAITVLPHERQIQAMKAGDTPPTPWWAVGVFPPSSSPTAAQPATVQETTAPSPFGGNLNVIHIDMPANAPGTFPYAICEAHIERLDGRPPKYLNILFKSDSQGWVDLMIPQTAWKGALSAPLDLSASKGEFVRVRLNLAQDFHLFANPFELTDLRNEIGFFNGKDIKNGQNRGRVSFDLVDIWYEY